jgi:EAL domain-containing protein (putative c-di-GMP-specific phosphodiesterase class I)
MTPGMASDHRRLLLHLPPWAAVSSDLTDLARSLEWRFYRDARAFGIDLGSEFTITSAWELLSLLRSVMDLSQVAQIRAAWLATSDCFEERLAPSTGGMLLVQLAKADSGPLFTFLHGGGATCQRRSIVRVADRAIWGIEYSGRLANCRSPISGYQLHDWALQENLVDLVDARWRQACLTDAAADLRDTEIHLLQPFFLGPGQSHEQRFESAAAEIARWKLSSSRIVLELVGAAVLSDLAALTQLCHAQGFPVLVVAERAERDGFHVAAEVGADIIGIDSQMMNLARTSSVHRQALETLIDFVHRRGKRVLARGINDPDEFELARRLGIDLAQGSHQTSARPLPRGTAQLSLTSSLTI